MPPEIAFSYEFFPVGQGLFSHGTLRKHSHCDKAFFRWVYDCGTVSRVINERISGALDLMANRTGGRDQLDLLFISHFDKDHINGITQLLRQVKKVGMIVLPYVRFERLVLFAVQGDIKGNDSVFGFFTDPVGYLTGLKNVTIDQILFVMPGEESDSYDIDVTPPADPKGQVIASRELVTPTGSEEDAFIAEADKHGKNTTCALLTGGTTLRIDAFWEFVPYNDDRQVELPSDWIAEVVKQRADLAKPNSPKHRENALKELKELYKKCFKRKQNELSLYVYTGPLTSKNWHRWYEYEFEKRIILNDVDEHHYCRCRGHAHHHWPHRPKLSLLYTGDGNLKPRESLNRLITFFRQGRIDRCAVFQVMHHGSRQNWHKGLAAQLAPCFSIFSSEPTRGNTYHPHADVVRDFLPYGPVQNDTNRWCQFHGSLHQ